MNQMPLESPENKSTYKGNIPRHTSFSEQPVTYTSDTEYKQPHSNGSVLRNRRNSTGSRPGTRPPGMDNDNDADYEMVPKPENIVEAHRLANNYMFGFKKWKSHVTERPIEGRSEVVRELYAEQQKISNVPVLRPGNIIYAFLFGWWLSLIYLAIALLMLITIVGRKYAPFCLQLAKYFLWPFGKFIHKNERHTEWQSSTEASCSSNQHLTIESATEDTPLFAAQPFTSSDGKSIWNDPVTYIWLMLGFLPLSIIHFAIFIISWTTVIFVPVAKINLKAIKTLLLMEPELLTVSESSFGRTNTSSHVVLYIHHAVHIYYYKYTIDGANIIAVNMLSLVVFTIGFGYGDPDGIYIATEVIFSLALVSMIPLAYFVGLCITRISARTNFAVGALLNASFGSIVELVMFILSLVKGLQENNLCYVALVKAALVDALVGNLLLVPGLCMIIGGIKHRTQRFNSRATSVSSTLLFVAVVGVFAPSIFSKTFGSMLCSNCYNTSQSVVFNETYNATTFGISCAVCHTSVFGNGDDLTLFKAHIEPLIYACAVILPMAYIVGLVYSMKTHREHIHEKFASKIDNENGDRNAGEKIVHWPLVKCIIVLFAATLLLSLAADIMTENMQEVLANSNMSAYFFGVTLLSMVPQLPEVINGVQFALQNNISLSIEVGTSVGIQICMLQIPILVLANVIYPMDFVMLFEDLHLWSAIVSLLMINYVFQDGKSDYFHGAALVLVYSALLSMYYFAPNIPACLELPT